jgi:hypothetical protein
MRGKKRILGRFGLLVLAMLAMCAVLSPVAALAYEFSGAGSEIDPFQITSAADLAKLAGLVNNGDGDYNTAYYILTKDIDLGGGNWTPIGESGATFQGIFHGQNHKITGLYIASAEYAGLFGFITDGAEIKNLGVEIAENGITATDSAAGVVGLVNEGRVTNCYSTGDVTATGTYGSAGGVAGVATGTPTHNAALNGTIATPNAPGNANRIIGGSEGINMSDNIAFAGMTVNG